LPAAALRQVWGRAISPGMEWIITLVIIGVALAGTLFSAWKSGRPVKDSVRTRWVSWPLLIVVCATVLVFAVIHAMNLMGMHTGQNTTGRYGF
jgi:hypothetical protein